MTAIAASYLPQIAQTHPSTPSQGHQISLGTMLQLASAAPQIASFEELRRAASFAKPSHEAFLKAYREKREELETAYSNFLKKLKFYDQFLFTPKQLINNQLILAPLKEELERELNNLRSLVEILVNGIALYLQNNQTTIPPKFNQEFSKVISGQKERLSLCETRFEIVTTPIEISDSDSSDDSDMDEDVEMTDSEISRAQQGVDYYLAFNRALMKAAQEGISSENLSELQQCKQNLERLLKDLVDLNKDEDIAVIMKFEEYGDEMTLKLEELATSRFEFLSAQIKGKLVAIHEKIQGLLAYAKKELSKAKKFAGKDFSISELLAMQPNLGHPNKTKKLPQITPAQYQRRFLSLGNEAVRILQDDSREIASREELASVPAKVIDQERQILLKEMEAIKKSVYAAIETVYSYQPSPSKNKRKNEGEIPQKEPLQSSSVKKPRISD